MRAFKAASVLALAVLTVSCTGNPSWGGTIGLKSFGLVSGNGKVTTEERAVSGFTAVSLSGSGSLRVHEGGFKVEVIADSNILPYIVTELVGTELRIGFKPGIGIARTTRLEFDVTMPGLAGIRVSGSGDATIDRFSGESFRAEISGSGSVEGALDYDRASIGVSGSGSYLIKGDFDSLDLDISGSGSGRLEGSARVSVMSISGSGSIAARDFTALALRASISGSGGLEIRVKDRLEAGTSGSGSISYLGNPILSSHASGSGSIRRLGD